MPQKLNALSQVVESETKKLSQINKNIKNKIRKNIKKLSRQYKNERSKKMQSLLVIYRCKAQRTMPKMATNT